MDIKEEIRVILLRKNLSMRKLITLLKENNADFGSVQNLSNKFRNKTIRFNEIESILEYLGYELKIEKSNNNNSQP